MTVWDWSGWAGVQGIASIVGLVAVGAAVVDFLANQQGRIDEVPRFDIKESRSLQNHAMMKITIALRVTGPQPVYEAHWRVWGGDVPLPELPGVMTAETEIAPLEFEIPRTQLEHVKIGVVWLVARRWQPYAKGLRSSLELGRPTEIYERRWWPWWPYKRASRWILQKDSWRHRRRFNYVP